jgi:hypothetical protein
METYRNAGHVELFEDGGKMNIILTVVSIKLTAPRTEILSTYYFMILFTYYFKMLFNIYSTPSDLTRTNVRQLNFRKWEKIISNQKRKWESKWKCKRNA